jgi:DNA repair ATPase RecN
MHGDQVHAFEGLTSRLADARMQMVRVQAARDRVREDLVSKQTEVAEIKARQEVLTKVSELYRVLIDKLVLDQVKTIEDVVTEGLRAIFVDQDLSFSFELAHKNNKVSAEPVLCQDGHIKGHPLESFGGGPSSIVSLILRVLVLLRMKRYRMLVLDETLAAVADYYVEETGRFLRKLSEASDLPILMVTHKQAYLDYATRAYQGDTKTEQSRTKFVVSQIKGVG